jgi:hypothetical protein
MVNPFAFGQELNHPPPEEEANVKFIDFEIPYHFFSTDYMRYFPYVMNTYDKVNIKLN